MSRHDGRTLLLLRKLHGALSRLRGLGLQQVEADAISGLQHLKWSDPDLNEKLHAEVRLVDTTTPTGLRGAIETTRTLSISRQ